MEANQNTNEQIQQLIEWYGNGNDGSCPTVEQWKCILTQPLDEPITLVNFFKLRSSAEYSQNRIEHGKLISGHEAFNSYAAVSVPSMERVGGKFLHVGPFSGVLIGNDEDWDIVAIGNFPNVATFLDLYTDAEYRKVFHHRTAACDRQKTLICAS